MSQAYLWDRGGGLTLIDTGISGSELAILEAVRHIGRSPADGGDTIASVEGTPILGPFNIDRELATESVRRQTGLEFGVACFGHGPPASRDTIQALAGRLP